MPGNLWPKGKSANPGGLRPGHRKARADLREALQKAFVQEDGTNLLIKALEAGVKLGDTQCLKMALEYTYGKPEQLVDVDLNGEGLPGIRVEFVRPGNPDGSK